MIPDRDPSPRPNARPERPTAPDAGARPRADDLAPDPAPPLPDLVRGGPAPHGGAGRADPSGAGPTPGSQGSHSRPGRRPGTPRTLVASASRVGGSAAILAALTFALPLLGFPDVVVARLQWMLPLVFVLAVLIDWLDERAEGHPWIDRLAGRLFDLWDSAGAGFYGTMGAATFVRLEIATVVDEFVTAGSVQDFLRGETIEVLLGFSLQSIANLVEAAVWFLPWLTGIPPHVTAVAIALCYGAYQAGRWSWVEAEEGSADGAAAIVSGPGERG